MINKERLALGVAALRSNEYTQGRGVLKQNSGGVIRHCCLGVLCEVAMANGLNLKVQEPSGAQETYSFEESVASLPESVIIWYGFESNDPELTEGVFAITANDYRRWSFEQIASAFEPRYILEEVNDGHGRTLDPESGDRAEGSPDPA